MFKNSYLGILLCDSSGGGGGNGDGNSKRYETFILFIIKNLKPTWNYFIITTMDTPLLSTLEYNKKKMKWIKISLRCRLMLEDESKWKVSARAVTVAAKIHHKIIEVWLIAAVGDDDGNAPLQGSQAIIAGKQAGKQTRRAQATHKVGENGSAASYCLELIRKIFCLLFPLLHCLPAFLASHC